eukprot:TRINITY_DN65569_c0_g1_i1.p1 TRINITY_DN65569_c0_g1~~TRINITY_DN65569_c0_g1_i1.p1  ORF type:complete len:120 (-),score=1.32 TRINITY_DN65569_c0_g1_i1:4-363(-)
MMSRSERIYREACPQRGDESNLLLQKLTSLTLLKNFTELKIPNAQSHKVSKPTLNILSELHIHLPFKGDQVRDLIYSETFQFYKRFERAPKDRFCTPPRSESTRLNSSHITRSRMPSSA